MLWIIGIQPDLGTQTHYNILGDIWATMINNTG